MFHVSIMRTRSRCVKGGTGEALQKAGRQATETKKPAYGMFWAKAAVGKGATFFFILGEALQPDGGTHQPQRLG